MPSLITVSGSRIPLCRGHSYVMGRGAECEIVVEDEACSRRHARILIAEAADAAFVEDLGSRNGTFLNGEPIGARTAVPESARVRVGATVFLFHLAEEMEHYDFEETRPATAELSLQGRRDVDGGELATFGLGEILKLLMVSRRNVTLHVALPGIDAAVDVRDGEVHAAHHGDLKGFPALVKLGRETSGIFWLNENTAPVERNVHESSAQLLVELLRCIGQPA